MTDQSLTRKPVAKRVSDNKASDYVSARQFHPPSIPSPTHNSRVPQNPTEKNLLFLPNQFIPMPTSNRYNDLYYYDSEDEPVFKEMVISKTLKPINTYSVVPL